jgi:peptide deformylase
MIKPILQLGNPILRKECLLVQDFDWNLKCLIDDLSDTLEEAKKRFGYGRGIAAPQIGELKRVVLIDVPSFKSPLVNPEIVWASNEMFEVWDSCFSFNVDFFVLADRHCRIGVEYSGLDGKKGTLAAEGELSELLQHEIDHLDGFFATDRMRNRKAIMMRSEWEKLFRSQE